MLRQSLLLGFLFSSLLFSDIEPLGAEATTVGTTVEPPVEPVREELLVCNKLKEFNKSPLFSQLSAQEETKKFYADTCRVSKKLTWMNSSLSISAQGDGLIEVINNTYDHGLNPNKYHKDDLVSYVEKIKNKKFESQEDKYNTVNRFDILLTDAYIALSKDLYYGFTDWKKFKTNYTYGKQANKKANIKDVLEWDRVNKQNFDSLKYLSKNLKSESVQNSLVKLYPDYEEYYRLVELLKYYRNVQKLGGWEKIPEGQSIRLNNNDKRLLSIKKRLQITGDLKEIENPNNMIYNEENLIRSVKSFQKSHNLVTDGLIGKTTVNALNIPVSTKISTIVLNMDRFRWMERGMDKSAVAINVNIPAFRMALMERGNEVFTMKVIVGKKTRPTPIINSMVSYAVVNPTWTAPETIVREDIIGKNNIESYLSSHHMKVYSTNDGEAVEVNSDDINWSSYAGHKGVPFTFTAEPGKSNPLGEVKFIFPNKYSVYMHDTNRRDLFSNNDRALSSGCIRLGEPKKLLSYLLEKEGNMFLKRNDMKTCLNRTVCFKNRVPVVFKYMTVSVDKSNRASFYDDVYKYDDLQLSTMKDTKWMF